MTGAVSLDPLSITAGSTITYSIVMEVIGNGGSVTGSDSFDLILSGLFSDNKPTSNLAVSNIITVPVVVEPTLSAENHAITTEFFLSHNYFYPANEELKLYFTVNQNCRMKIKVYTILGNLVKTLFDDDVYVSTNPNAAILYNGDNDSRLRWDGTADDGMIVSSGTYIILFDTGYSQEIKKVNLIR